MTLHALSLICGFRPGPSAPRSEIERFRRTQHLSLDRQISLLENGPADLRPLLLIHGTPGRAEGWIDYVRTPPSGLRVLAPDRPGFGASIPTGACPSLGDQASAMLALIDRPALLLGHSLGAAIALKAAIDQPDRVAGLLLLAGAADPGLEKTHPLQPLGVRPGFRWLLPRALAHANIELLALKAELQAMAADLARIACPVLIVHGTSDRLVPYGNVAYLNRKLTGSRAVKIITIQNGDHFLPWNASDAVRQGIARLMEMAP